MQPRAELNTARLRLRPVAPDDEAAVLDGLKDLAVSGWLAVVPHPYTAADFHAFQTSYALPGQTFAIEDAKGFAGILGVEDRTLGYWLAPRAQGLGYASEAARAALAEHFRANSADIASGYFEGNARSANVLRKLGFVEVGRDMKFCRALGQDRPHVNLCLTQKAFHAQALIQTARLSMRPMTRADAPLFHDLVTRPEVARMLYLFHPGWTLAEAEAFLDDWAWRGALRFRLALVHQGKWAGWIGVSDDAEPEVFYALRPEFSGQGLAAEAVAAFSAFLFDHFNLPALTAGVFTDNPASARVLAKCGYQLTREELHASRGRLAPAPARVYRLANLKKAEPHEIP